MIFVFLLAFTFVSCSFQKRLYLNGYHVERLNKEVNNPDKKNIFTKKENYSNTNNIASLQHSNTTQNRSEIICFPTQLREVSSSKEKYISNSSLSPKIKLKEIKKIIVPNDSLQDQSNIFLKHNGKRDKKLWWLLSGGLFADMGLLAYFIFPLTTTLMISMLILFAIGAICIGIASGGPRGRRYRSTATVMYAVAMLLIPAILIWALIKGIGHAFKKNKK